MRFGPRRGNPMSIFEHPISTFGVLVVSIFVLLRVGPDYASESFYLVFIGFINLIQKLVAYLTTFYTVDESQLTIQTGFIKKKVTHIPLNRITTVDLTQNLLFQIFHVYKIKIDNGSQANNAMDNAEAVLVLKERDAYEFKQLLGTVHEDLDDIVSGIEKAESNGTVQSKSMDFVLRGALQSKIAYWVIVMITAVSCLLMADSFSVDGADTDGVVIQYLNSFPKAYVIVVFLAGSYVFSIGFSIVSTLVRYANYTIDNRHDSLFIRYGLLTKKSYTLKKEKINGICIEQSLLMSLFGYCTIRVYIIGYGDESDGKEKEEALLYPIVKKSEINLILGQVLPELCFVDDYERPKRQSLRYFFYTFRSFVALVLIILVLVEDEAIGRGVGLAIIVWIYASIFLNYRKEGLLVTKHMISVRKGFLGKQYVLIKNSKLEYVQLSGSRWKRKKGYGTITVGFVAPCGDSTMKARNMTLEQYEKVKNILTY